MASAKEPRVKNFLDHTLDATLGPLLGALSPRKFRPGIKLGLKSDDLTVIRVSKGSAAERIGIKVGDIIMEIDGRAVEKDRTRTASSASVSPKHPHLDLEARACLLLESDKEGTEIPVKVRRAGLFGMSETLSFRLKCEPPPSPPATSPAATAKTTTDKPAGRTGSGTGAPPRPSSAPSPRPHAVADGEGGGAGAGKSLLDRTVDATLGAFAGLAAAAAAAGREYRPGIILAAAAPGGGDAPVISALVPGSRVARAGRAAAGDAVIAVGARAFAPAGAPPGGPAAAAAALEEARRLLRTDADGAEVPCVLLRRGLFGSHESIRVGLPCEDLSALPAAAAAPSPPAAAPASPAPPRRSDSAGRTAAGRPAAAPGEVGGSGGGGGAGGSAEDQWLDSAAAAAGGIFRNACAALLSAGGAAAAAAATAVAPAPRAAVLLRRRGVDVVIAGVVAGSAAARAGAVAEGDVLLEVTGRAVGPDEPLEAVALRLRADAPGADAAAGVAVRVRRAGLFGLAETREVRLPFEAAAAVTEL